MKKIVVVGSFNMDMIVETKRIPKPGETVMGGKFSQALGGKGANQAVAAARLGGDVAFVSRVGEDSMADQAIAAFGHDGIDTRYVARDSSCASGVALIVVDEQGENCIAVAPGANGRLSPSDIESAEGLIASAGILIAQLEIPLETVRCACELARRHGAQVILNPAPARELDKGLLSSVTVLTPNESEAELLTGIVVSDEQSAGRAANALRACGVAAAIITMGSRGAYVSSDSFTGIVSGFEAEAVDTTAAGDVFNGALAVALGEGVQLKDAVRFANAAAAISVTRLGAQPSVPTRDEVDCYL